MPRRIATWSAALSVLAIAACSPSQPGDTETVTSETEAENTGRQIVQIDPSNDPRVWLEEVEGTEAMAWVEGQNERTYERLQGDALYQELFDEAREPWYAMLMGTRLPPYTELICRVVYALNDGPSHALRRAVAAGVVEIVRWEIYNRTAPENPCPRAKHGGSRAATSHEHSLYGSLRGGRSDDGWAADAARAVWPLRAPRMSIAMLTAIQFCCARRITTRGARMS